MTLGPISESLPGSALQRLLPLYGSRYLSIDADRRSLQCRRQRAGLPLVQDGLYLVKHVPRVCTRRAIDCGQLVVWLEACAVGAMLVGARVLVPAPHEQQ
jgi:hypothetical protein